MSIVTNGPMMSPDIAIGEVRVPLGQAIGAAGSDAFEDSATQQLLGIHELSAAKGGNEIAPSPTDPMGAPIPSYEEAPRQRPGGERVDMIDALDQVKKAGLDKSLKLPDEPDIAPAALQIMMSRARTRAEHAATIARGPQGLIPDALMVGTSFLVGAVDPLNIASAFVPVMGELRYGKLLAEAGESAAARAGLRAGVGAAQGVTGQALLEPIDWFAHSQDGRDFGMSDVLHNLVLGGLLGAGLHSGGGAISDAWRAHKGRPLYPYGPGEPADRSVAPAESAAAITPDMDAVDRVLAGQSAAPLREVAPEFAVLDDLPPRAQEDAARASIASLLDGTPVRAAEMLDAAAQTDPRIAASFDLARPPEALTPQAARQAVADDIRQKLLDAGLPPEQADANAAVTAARYNARAERLGGGQSALDLYRGENLAVRSADGTALASPAEARSFLQSQPQSPPFYSAVDRAVTAAGQDKASPQQWLGTLKNAAGVKPEEMKWLGLEDWLKQQKGSVTKQQLQDYVRANAIEVKQVTKGGSLKAKLEDQWEKAADAVNAGISRNLSDARMRVLRDRRDDLRERLAAASSDSNNTKFPSYTLPGGENYREMLLTLPDKTLALNETRKNEIFTRREAIQDQFDTLYGKDDLETIGARKRLTAEFNDLTDELQRLNQFYGDRSSRYKSSHWEEPNVLAHIRFDDRMSDGKKTLHLAEVQSDWHQAGKRKGYKGVGRDVAAIDKDIDANLAELRKREPTLEKDDVTADDYQAAWEKNPELDQRQTELYRERGNMQGGGVPDAPFKTTWPELAMKRMIRYAAEHGYDRVSWDTGATNAERYDLSKQVQKIEAIKFSDGVWRLDGIDQHGQSFALANQVPAEKLADYVGKDLAERIVNDKRQKPNSVVSYSGLDLKVGGEGMAGFYDKILPATVNKLVKKFGAKVESSKLDHLSVADEPFPDAVDITPQKQVHSLDITPDLRQAAMETGFPLFQGGAENPRGRITLSDNAAIIDLFHSRDASTFMHESGHLWLDELMRDAAHPDAPAPLRADRDAVLNWLGVGDASGIKTEQHEKWAQGFEHYLKTGEAPSSALARAFEQFRQWIAEIYRALSGAGESIPPEIKAVMDRMLATEAEIADRSDELGATTRAVRKTARGRAAADPQTWSLFEYLASKGGLKPDPELEAIFGGKRGPMIGGFGPLLRNDGMALDEALRVAKEGHYLFDAADVSGAEARLTPRDLLDSVDRESRGNRVYRNDHVVSDRAIPPEEEAKHIVDALHDELEAGGQNGPAIDPRLEARVVEIVQKEGERDVLAAYERAIMEDAERYEGLAYSRRQIEATGHLPGWDAAEPAAAPRAGAADRGGGGQARLSAAGAGAGDGGEPRGAGIGDRAPGPAQLAPGLRPQGTPSPEAWHGLARAVPEYDAPDAVRASQAADAAPDLVAVNATASERTKAALAADQKSAELYQAKAAFLSPEERVRVDDALRAINIEESDRREIFARGAVCLAEAAGVVA